MTHVIKRTAVAVTAVAVAAGGVLLGAPAQAVPTSTTQIRSGDLIAPSDTADGGVQQFLHQGVHLRTVNNTGYARGTFAVGVPLAQVATVDFTWYGTDFSPGIKYYVDADADGKIDGELRGEDVYGGKDVWLNGDTQDYPASALPDNYFADHAPCTGATQAPGATDPCGSSGASKHGSLADWAKLLQAATGKAPVVVNGGWSLTGAAADGVLIQITYGPEQFVFTDLAKAKVTVDATAKKAQINRGQKARIQGHVEPAGTGAKVSLEAKIKGKWTVLKTKVLAANGNFKFGDKPAKMGVNRYRVQVTETNATMSAKSKTVKVRVIRHHRR
ncbi:hypothetical protein [Nocardioides halotolerans]|jgi:hypothetical protein|uniref:hypothetical protein n=1 Tax=Nocardioides halotolerans TaxID=433660 RepID=UPI00041D4046|nr:hypothetical protein [Nocardioides halotolerans]